MRICVYTCITGGYDNIKEIKYKNASFDYLCFTNNRSIKSDTWEVIYVDSELDDQLLARKIKILYSEYLEGYDASLYIDGKVLVGKDVTQFIEHYLEKEVDLVGYKHPYRNCIYDEIYYCIIDGKETLQRGAEIRDMYLDRGYPRQYGMSDTAIMLRRHNKETAELMKRWFHMVETYSRRDQFSLFYCLWEKPVKTMFLDDNIEDNEYFLIDHSHIAQGKSAEAHYIVDFNPEGNHELELVTEGKYQTGGVVATSLEITVPADSEAFNINVSDSGFCQLEYSADPDLKAEFINGIPLEERNLFIDSFCLRISGHMEEGRAVRLKLNIKKMSRHDFAYYINIANMKNIQSSTELEILKNSTSWKVTAPLRKGMDAIRILRKR